jgi:tetratricopeptide (TPR) repeat protein
MAFRSAYVASRDAHDERSPAAPVAANGARMMIEALKFYEKAFIDLDDAIRLAPTYAPAYRHRGNTIVATYKARKVLGKPTNNILDNAIKDFNTAIELDSNSKTNPDALGRAYLVKREYDSAIKYFKVAIAHDHRFAAPYAGLCTAYKALGNEKLAGEYARLAAELDDALKSRACLTRQD